MISTPTSRSLKKLPNVLGSCVVQDQNTRNPRSYGALNTGPDLEGDSDLDLS
jgi:hypothetical protein